MSGAQTSECVLFIGKQLMSRFLDLTVILQVWTPGDSDVGNPRTPSANVRTVCASAESTGSSQAEVGLS